MKSAKFPLLIIYFLSFYYSSDEDVSSSRTTPLTYVNIESEDSKQKQHPKACLHHEECLISDGDGCDEMVSPSPENVILL